MMRGYISKHVKKEGFLGRNITLAQVRKYCSSFHSDNPMPSVLRVAKARPPTFLTQHAFHLHGDTTKACCMKRNINIE